MGGISIEQYRSRIGSYDNFVKTKDMLSRFKDNFWSLVLMMFYLNVFYLPVLKQVVGQRKMWNDVMFWFLQMIFYNAYIPLLIRQANDVEENPGPTIFDFIDATRTICADYSQGNEALFGETAGKQCVAMSLTAIIYHHIENINLWTSSTLNSILTIGNNLYISIRCSVQANDYLLLTDVPCIVSIYNKVYTLAYSESFTGNLFMTSNNGPYMSLHNSLTELFSNCQLNYNCCLLTIGINTVAVIKNSEQSFKIFDAHSRDLHGMPHSFGKCTLLTIEGIENLVSYLQISCLQIGVVPFKIKGVFVRGNEIDLQNGNESRKIEHLCFSDKRNQTQPMKRKQKFLTETPEEKEKRLIAKREYEKRRKVTETSEEKEKRLIAKRECEKRRKVTETPEEKQKRLTARREYEKRRKVNESEESKEKRLARQRLNMKKERASECCESRKKRLATQSQYERQKIAYESAECREERLFNQRQYQKEKIANESAGDRQERLANQRQYQSEKNVHSLCITDEIRKFHANVSRGPEYICSCCNQLWYKHSVITAEKLRLSNPTAGKY